MKLVLFLALFFPALCHSETESNFIQIETPHIRFLPPGSPNTAAYMTLTNNSEKEISLVGVETDLSKKAEFHTHQNMNGQLKMIQVDKIKIPARSKVILKPGGDHIMILDLKKNLHESQRANLTLIYADQSKKTIAAPVQKIQSGGHTTH